MSDFQTASKNKREVFQMQEGLSRREIIKGTGLVAVGAVLGKLGGMVSNAEAKAKDKWPYEKIDPEKAAEAAYQSWFDVFCAQATATGLFGQLGEKVGEPWKSFPISSLKFGMGGMLGWGLTCGSPVAASLVIGLAAAPELVNPMINDLLQWYTETSLPVYVPKNPKFVKGEFLKTTSNSPLCHVSVGKWMKAANKPFGSEERRDRCARLSASVAYKTAEMLNAWKDGKYKERDVWAAVASVGIPAQQNCGNCHGSNVPVPPMKK
jgi:hypothetical protein